MTITAPPITSPDQRGSQSLEMALAIPVVLFIATIVVAVGQIVLSLSTTHQIAVSAARLAATAHDSEVLGRLDQTDIAVVDIQPPSGSRQPGDLVTVTITRTVPVLWVQGSTLDVSAAAAFLTEDAP
ncbi:MAG: TadE/TadG family type IV pilus assembly protein [Euzebya sp.]